MVLVDHKSRWGLFLSNNVAGTYRDTHCTSVGCEYSIVCKVTKYHLIILIVFFKCFQSVFFLQDPFECNCG